MDSCAVAQVVVAKRLRSFSRDCAVTVRLMFSRTSGTFLLLPPCNVDTDLLCKVAAVTQECKYQSTGRAQFEFIAKELIIFTSDIRALVSIVLAHSHLWKFARWGIE